jgi:hypothetical protein
MNIWRRGPLSRNPYSRTAFRVTRVPRETARHKTVVQIIGQTRKVVGNSQEHTIAGKPVTVVELNEAQQIILDPQQRIIEELLEHPTEKLHLERVRKLAREIAESMSGPASATSGAGARYWARNIVAQFLDAAPGPDPSFGALEMSVIPPFGRQGED